MPRRGTKRLPSEKGASRKRQKRRHETKNKSGGAGSSFSKPAASEDSVRDSGASSVPHTIVKPDGTSEAEKPSAVDSISQDDGGSTGGRISEHDSIFKGNSISKVDSTSEDDGGSIDGRISEHDGVSKDNSVSKIDSTSRAYNSPTIKAAAKLDDTSMADSIITRTTLMTDSVARKSISFDYAANESCQANNEVPNEVPMQLADGERDEALRIIRHEADEAKVKLIRYMCTTNQAAIVEAWSLLILRINGGAMAFMSDASWENLGADTQNKLSSWCPKAKKMLESSPWQWPLLHRAWIWHILDENLFSAMGTGKVWRNELWESYHKLHDAFQACRSNRNDVLNVKYQFWKQITFELLHFGCGERWGRVTVDQITDLIQSELGPANPDRLRSVARQALEVDRLLKSSAVDWVVTFGHPKTGQLTGFSYDSEFMDPEESEKDRTEGLVDLVISPLLRARGDENGVGYDRIEKTANMTVVVDWTCR